MNEIDGSGRIRARYYGPDHLFQVGYIDIIVYDDHVFPGVGADMALRGDMAALSGMAGVTLLDGDAPQHSRVSALARPGGLDALKSGFIKRLLEESGAEDRSVAGDFIGWPLRGASQDNGIVAVVEDRKSTRL